MRVHRALGPGFLESAYQEAFGIALHKGGIPFVREQHVPVFFEGQQLATGYRADFVCFGGVIVELKAKEALVPANRAQVLHYLRATGFRRGLLVNFGAASLQVRRFVNGFGEVDPEPG